jgi:hypothetical protein
MLRLTTELKGLKQMKEMRHERVDEGGNEETSEAQKIELEDLQPAVNVSAGLDHKSTDVTLKRGIID